MDSSVDFPLPDGPITPRTSPSSTTPLIPCSSTLRPEAGADSGFSRPSFAAAAAAAAALALAVPLRRPSSAEKRPATAEEPPAPAGAAGAGTEQTIPSNTNAVVGSGSPARRVMDGWGARRVTVFASITGGGGGLEEPATNIWRLASTYERNSSPSTSSSATGTAEITAMRGKARGASDVSVLLFASASAVARGCVHSPVLHCSVKRGWTPSRMQRPLPLSAQVRPIVEFARLATTDWISGGHAAPPQSQAVEAHTKLGLPSLKVHWDAMQTRGLSGCCTSPTSSLQKRLDSRLPGPSGLRRAPGCWVRIGGGRGG